MAYEGSESAGDNFGKFIYQFQPETKILIWKLESILNKLYRQNLSLLFNETCLNEQLLPNYTLIYIVFFGPVKPELGVIPSGQEIIHEWILKFSW